MRPRSGSASLREHYWRHGSDFEQCWRFAAPVLQVHQKSLKSVKIGFLEKLMDRRHLCAGQMAMAVPRRKILSHLVHGYRCRQGRAMRRLLENVFETHGVWACIPLPFVSSWRDNRFSAERLKSGLGNQGQQPRLARACVSLKRRCGVGQ